MYIYFGVIVIRPILYLLSFFLELKFPFASYATNLAMS